MAKCKICNQKKAKRVCVIKDESMICPVCCAKIRENGKCPSSCRYYSEAMKFEEVKHEKYQYMTSAKLLPKFIDNFDKYNALLTHIIITLGERIHNDPFYTDEHVITGLKRTIAGYDPKLFLIEKERPLNRSASIEDSLKQAVRDYQAHDPEVTEEDILVCLYGYLTIKTSEEALELEMEQAPGKVEETQEKPKVENPIIQSIRETYEEVLSERQAQDEHQQGDPDKPPEADDQTGEGRIIIP